MVAFPNTPFKPPTLRTVVEQKYQRKETADSAKYPIVYRSVQRSPQSNWEADGILTIQPSGRATVKDASEWDITLASGILSRPTFPKDGEPMRIGPYIVQLNPEEPPSTSTIFASTGTQKPFMKHSPLKAASVLAQGPCHECLKSTLSCDGHSPCQQCISNGHTFCSRINFNHSQIHRTMCSATRTQVVEDHTKACQNCKSFGLTCGRETPCLNCIDKGRAFCTVVSGNVTTTLCAAFGQGFDQEGRRRVVPKEQFEGDAEEAWPEWPPAKPLQLRLSEPDNAYSHRGRLSASLVPHYIRGDAASLFQWY